MDNTQKQVSQKELTELVDKGYKKPQLAQHFGVSQSAIADLLKQASLKIRKFHKNKPVLVNDLDGEITHQVTSEDLKNNPELEEQSVAEGDVVSFLKEDTEQLQVEGTVEWK